MQQKSKTAPKHTHKAADAQTVNTLKHKAVLTREKPFIFLFFSGPSPVLTFVLRVVVSVRSGWWEVDAGRGTAQSRMSIITY